MIQQIQKLIDESASLGATNASLSLLQEAVRLAESNNHRMLAFEARRELMWMSRHLLRSTLLATAFAQQLSQYDASPEEYAEFNPIAEYPWVIGLLSNFPNISIVQRNEMLDDLTRRLQAANESVDEVHELKWSIAIDFADRELATAAREALDKGPASLRDPTFLYNDVLYWLFLGDEQRAIQVGEKFLSGQFYEENICAELLLPLVRAGRSEEALRIHNSLPKMHRDSAYYWPYGSRIRHLAMSGQLDSAIKYYEAFQRIVSQYSDPLTKLYFYTDMIPVFEQLQRSGANEVSLRLSDEVKDLANNGRYLVSELRQWIVGNALELASQFDRRNGNDYYTARISV